MISPAEFYGGVVEVTASAHVIKTWRAGRVYRLTFMSAGTYTLDLPTIDEAVHEQPLGGGPQFYIVNDGLYTVTVRQRTGGSTTTLVDLGRDKVAIIVFKTSNYGYTTHNIST